MTPETASMIPADYTPAANLLENRVILVTGAGQGLGRATALACAHHGATVALLGRKQGKLEKVYDEIVAATLPRPAIIPLDLAQAGDGEFEQVANLVRRDLKGLHGIAHCASHFVPLGPLGSQSLDTWNALQRVNLAAPFALTRACLPLLSADANSSVVFTGETHGAHPRAYWGGFAVAKSGLSTLAAVWADELEHAGRPRLNVFIPGPINSPQRAQSHPGEDRAQLRSPDEAARAILWLLGPESAALNGRTLEW
jgi:NAD(P)-dependent dehydrogenase (short-subunit alcohol dehydrogenase family)